MKRCQRCLRDYENTYKCCTFCSYLFYYDEPNPLPPLEEKSYTRQKWIDVSIPTEANVVKSIVIETVETIATRQELKRIQTAKHEEIGRIASLQRESKRQRQDIRSTSTNEEAVREWIKPSDPDHTMHKGYRIHSKVIFQSHVYVAKWDVDKNDAPFDYPFSDTGLSWKRLTARLTTPPVPTPERFRETYRDCPRCGTPNETTWVKCRGCRYKFEVKAYVPRKSVPM